MASLSKVIIGSIIAFIVYRIIQRINSQKSKSKNLINSTTIPKKNINDVLFLNKKEKKPIKLVKRTDLSHDSAVLRFSLDSKQRVLGLPVGKHFKLIMPNLKGIEQGKWNGRDDVEIDKEMITRSYTPTSGDELKGFVDLVVKFYKPNDKPQFPDGGRVSRQLNELKIGEEINIQGPFGRVEYIEPGKFKIGRKEVEVKEVGMMAGGSGITPMLQILRYSLPDAKDETKFSLIYANQTEEDILLRKELEEYQQKYPEKFHLHFTLDRPNEKTWKYSKGFITEEMIKENLPKPSKDTLMLMCGPPPMVKYACKQNMEKLGYSKESQIEF